MGSQDGLLRTVRRLLQMNAFHAAQHTQLFPT